MTLAAGVGDAWLAVALSATWKSSLLLLLCAAAAVLLRRSSAALRHLLWAVALAGVLAIPPLGQLVPGWSVSVPGWLALPAAPPAASRTGAAAADDPGGPSSTPSPGGQAETSLDQRSPADAPRRGPASGGGRRADAAQPVARATTDSGPVASSWPSLLFLVWLVGAAVVVLATLAGLVRVRLLDRRARPLREPLILERLHTLEEQLGLVGRVRLLETAGAVMPVTWGVRRAAILLPAQAREWHPALLEAVLLHELAHVQRRDLLTQLGAELVCALHWFNPLVWWAAGRLRDESELACDDIGARGLAGRPEYARELVELARALRSQRRLTVAAIALARRAQLTARVIALLDEGRSHLSASRRQRNTALAVGCLVALPLSALSPRAPMAAPLPSAAVTSPPVAELVLRGVVPLAPEPRGVRPHARAKLTPPGPHASAPTQPVAGAAASPAIALTTLTPFVIERRQASSRQEADMRALSSSAAAVLAGLTLGAPNVAGQQPQPASFTIVGTVTDSMTGRPIADVALAFRPAYRTVMTDSLGRFLLRGVRARQQTVVVQQLGYEERTLSLEAQGPVSRLSVRLNPDPVVLQGLTVVVRDYHRLLKRLAIGRVYERRDLLSAGTAANLCTFLVQSGAITPAVSPGCTIGLDSVWVHGRRVRLPITFDDQPIGSGGLGALPAYPISEIYAVVVGLGGSSVTVLTNWYIEYLARTGQRLQL